MSRLTIDEIINHCRKTCESIEVVAIAQGKNQDDITSKQYWEHYLVGEWLNELKKYKDAEEQGLLIKLPCKVGDTVWFVGNDFVNDYEVRRYIIDETGVDCIQIAKEIDGRDYWNSFSIDDFNKTVFLTKEEAEQKLKEMESDTNGKN